MYGARRCPPRYYRAFTITDAIIGTRRWEMATQLGPATAAAGHPDCGGCNQRPHRVPANPSGLDQLLFPAQSRLSAGQ